MLQTNKQTDAKILPILGMGNYNNYCNSNKMPIVNVNTLPSLGHYAPLIRMRKT